MQSWTYCALIIRVLVALCTRTFFQPDEYFQSLEPAYHLVFGYGHLTWEWLSPQPIRSIIYPALNVPIYWLLKFTGLSESAILGDWLLVSELLHRPAKLKIMPVAQISCPKFFHGLLAAGTDIWLAELSRIVLGRDYVSTVVRGFRVNNNLNLCFTPVF
jgi:GPI mannosyltransferase 3